MRDQSTCSNCGQPATGTVQMLHPEVATQKDAVCADCLDWWRNWAKDNDWADLRIEEYAKA